MKRESSHITLNRGLVESFGHFPSMVLDCLRSRIEFYLATDASDDRYFQIKNGLAYIKASGSFIANWIMCDRSTAAKALIKLTKEGVLEQEFFSGNSGAWYAFSSTFIKLTNHFFDASVKRYLEQVSREFISNSKSLNSNESADIISTQRCDEISAGADIITPSADIITPSPIYTLNNTNNHLNAREATLGGGGLSDETKVDSFLSDRDAYFRDSILETLDAYPDLDPVALIMDALDWQSCRKTTRKQVKGIAAEYGFTLYAAAVVMAAAERSLGNPVSFIRKVCKRLRDQKQDNERRRSKSSSPAQPAVAVRQQAKQLYDQMSPSQQQELRLMAEEAFQKLPDYARVVGAEAFIESQVIDIVAGQYLSAA